MQASLVYTSALDLLDLVKLFFFDEIRLFLLTEGKDTCFGFIVIWYGSNLIFATDNALFDLS